ncbi:MAG TPA: hypothetical protein VFN68_16320 [Acidimicrobiales bacterium]|nr:hypothetical protein [Acidimicrobiales bacterium]
MTAELILADAVRDWVVRVLPGDPDAADAAVAYALASFAAGASVSESCEAARRMALSRSRHPSSMAAGRGRLRAAS